MLTVRSLRPMENRGRRVLRARNLRAGKWIAVWFFLVTALSLAPISVKTFLRTVGPLHDFGHLVVFAVSGVLVL